MAITEKKKQRKATPASATVKKVIRKEKLYPEESVTLKAEEPHVRYLKIQPVHRQSQQQTSIVPELRLNGRWLEKIGFSPEEYVSVTVMEGLLLIRSTET